MIWLGAGLGFGVYVAVVAGGVPAQEYYAAYLIEKSLSLDNLFVFLLIFQTLNIPHRHQRTALSWGIFGALVFRALFIHLGSTALHRWEWVEFVFGGLLIVAAWRAFREDPAQKSDSKLIRWLAQRFPVSRERDTHHFFLQEAGRRVATPLMIAVLGLEVSDILFAIDSVPAAFSITRNEFLIYSSNAFAILGLRSLFLVLAHTLAGMKYLHYGLAAVLAFAGVKIAFSQWIDIPPWLSILITLLCLGTAMAASWKAPRN